MPEEPIPNPVLADFPQPERLAGDFSAAEEEALARLVCPEANIPSTTALATLNRETGRELGLARGANVTMPNLTPAPYRALYEIYPHKACLSETAHQNAEGIGERLRALGRPPGRGPGSRRHAPA
jgi:biotin synthase